MMKIFYYLPILLLLPCAESAAQTTAMLAQASIIPKPVSIVSAGKFHVLHKDATISVHGGKTDELERIGGLLSEKLKASTGYDLAVSTSNSSGRMMLVSASGEKSRLGTEGYELEIREDGLTLTAASPEGLFRGVQTLLQLLPGQKDSIAPVQTSYQIPTGTILDYPAYSYRGAMLDVARHFFGVEDVKRFIDLISVYKMNVLHLHLTDDQGWRIEVKSWPRLTAHGGSTAVGGGPGGYFTQDDYREIVRYGRERYVTIVPEIDMPGHTNAALSSYPELNCDGKAPDLYTGTRVGFSSLCTAKDITYEFVDDVIREIADITPGPYIHIGGDESHETSIDDYIPFINKTRQIVQKHGKIMIGWDEVAHADLDSSAVVQYWAEAENAVRGAEQNAKIIMSPATKAYLDMQYNATTVLGQNWAGYIAVDSAYEWDPAILVPGIAKEAILGVEAPLWTETISTMDEIEYMVFPRLPGIAEIGWTPAEDRDWSEYRTRLARHGKRLDAMDVNYYASDKIDWGL